jgi:hypothetical protein
VETSDAETTSIRTFQFQTHTADSTIWEAREYYLAVFETRAELVVKHWAYLIHKLESGINQYVSSQSPEVPRVKRIRFLIAFID